MKKRWDFAQMVHAGQTLFKRIHRRKHMASPNHDVHLLARSIDEWLPQGIQSMIEGTYTPRFLKRYYLKDEMLDQLYLADRVLQYVLLQQLKPTFPYVMNPNCTHLHGPAGVQLATQRIREALATGKYKYIIRADIKSYYKSIQHHVLIEDIKRHYTDIKVQLILENVIRNPIETPRGYKNPDNGIALRGPLSQFFSALYLKPLDDAFDTMDVTYLRYQDDIIILCQTSRQLERCKRRLMTILKERHLQLSRKKTRIGSIANGFHFLGIDYLETQTPDSTNRTQDIHDLAAKDALIDESCLLFNQTGGGNNNSTKPNQKYPEQIAIVPHARTIRNAREQVRVTARIYKRLGLQSSHFLAQINREYNLI
jgi:RNA-directed DNA polymerase